MTYTFTDDFEDGDLAGYSNVGPGTTNSTAAAFTGSRGMRQAPDGTNNGVASLSDSTLPDGYVYADVEFDFQQNAHTSGNSPVLTVGNRGNVNNADLYVNYGADGHMWWDIVGTDNAETAAAVVLGEWHHWRIVVYYGGTSWTMRVWLDGVQQSTVTSTGMSASDVRVIHFGGFATDPNVRYYDNISVLLTNTDPVTTTVSGAAALSGSGTLTAAGSVRQQAAVNLAGGGNLTAGGAVRQQAAAALTASGAFAAVALNRPQATATLTGSGSLSAAGAQRIAAAAALAGAGTLTAASIVRAQGSAALTAAGSLTAAGRVRVQGAASLSGTGTLDVTLGAVRASAALFASGSLSATGRVRVLASAALSAFGGLTAGGLVRVQASAALSGAGTLTITLPGGPSRGSMGYRARAVSGLVPADRTGAHISSRDRAGASMGGA